MVNENALNRSVNKHQTNMQRVNILAQTEARAALSVLPDMTFGEQATHVRTVIPTIISKYGNVASTVAVNHYIEMRALQEADLGLEAFTPIIPSTINFTEEVDAMIGYSIAKNDTIGVQAMASFLIDELTLHVSNYDRETINFNAKREPKTVKIQRVAEPKACAFCATLAAAGVVYEGIAWDEEVVTHANKWHSNCHCSTEVIYANRNGQYDSLIRPDYYDSLEAQYKEAQAAQASIRQDLMDKYYSDFDKPSLFFKAYPEAATTTQNVAAQMRIISGRK